MYEIDMLRIVAKLHIHSRQHLIKISACGRWFDHLNREIRPGDDPCVDWLLRPSPFRLTRHPFADPLPPGGDPDATQEEKV